MSQKKVAIVGATGAVGQKMIEFCRTYIPHNISLKLLASKRSQGQKISIADDVYHVEELTENSFDDCQIALFSAGSQVSAHFAPYAVQSGCVVIDNTSHFRMDASVPLVVPEVNADQIQSHKGIIANPNCSTIQLVLLLNVLEKEYGLERVIVSTYQSVSGAGFKALEELKAASARYLEDETITPSSVFQHPIPFNLIPQIDVFCDNLYTKEEMKMINESRKILSCPDLPLTATAVRIPVMRTHGESVNITLKKDTSRESLHELLRQADGVTVSDDPEKEIYPMPLTASNKSDVFIGRIRRDDSYPQTFHFWIVSDNLLKGAAVNALQIAKKLL